MRRLCAWVAVAVPLLLWGCGGLGSTTCSLEGGAPLASTAWPKYRKDSGNTGFARDVDLSGASAAPVEAWRFATGGPLQNSAVLDANGTVFIGAGSGRFYSLVGDTGALNPPWQFCSGGDNDRVACKTDADCAGTVSGVCEAQGYLTNGPISATALIDAMNTVFIPSGDGTLYFLSTVDGTELRTRLPLSSPLLRAPALASEVLDLGVVYVVSDVGSLFAACPNDALRWIRGTSPNGPTPAVASDGTLYTTGGGAGELVRALAADTGAVLWSFSASASILVSPVAGATGTIYVADNSGNAFAISSDGTRNTDFSYTAPGPVTTDFAVANSGGADSLYVASGGQLAALSSTGAVRWTFGTPGGAAIRSAPIVTGDGTVIFGADDGNLYALQDNGAGFQTRWMYTLGSAVRSSPSIRQSASGTLLYVGAEDGNLYALRLQ